ncbi:MAG: carboxy terminal-processing peptidase [Desulfofustis sp.]|jgi:carboxyl-terminal processing protease|nr:carboxy terminal-processing peptidase [Desulfofustis sp.]
MKSCNHLFRITILLITLSLTAPWCLAEGGSDGGDDVDQKRNKLIGYILGKQLPTLHFSDREMNDALSRAAFDLYLKQLDFQKRFLLQSDVEELKEFAELIDDNLVRGTITLPETGYAILEERIRQVETIVADLLAEKMDPDQPESMESDPEKLDYVEDLEGLRQRWRLLLKAQIINRYLDLEDQRQADGQPIDRAALWAEARERVSKRFTDFFHRLHQETRQDHYDRYFNAVARAFDPHTNYMAPDRKEDFDIHMRGSLEGIGALLREEDGYIKVVRIIPGSASARQGRLQAEDIIQAVAEGDEEAVEITDMRLRDAVRLIRGPKGTEVRLTVMKPDGTKDIIPIVRDVVQIEETFVKQTVLEVDDHRFGYISIPSFYRDFEKSGGSEQGRNSTDDTRNAILALKEQGIEGIILDLRDNGGGSLVDAVDIAGLFINEGPVVQVKNSYGLKRILEDEDDSIVYDGPLVVLVNQFSASASEIVAAALQDYRRAVVIGGQHTHGKGTVQTIIDLNENIPLLHLRRYDDLGALKATIQKFYRVNGGSTQYRGVEPDIVLPSLFQHLESGEQYLDYSLPWDQESPADYRPYRDKITDLETVVERSRQRLAASEELQLIEAEAVRSRQRSEQTLLTLDIDSMRARRDEERQARERVGANYLRLEQELQMNDDGGDEQDDAPSDNDDRTDWIKKVSTDPYISEAQMILRDLTDLLTP